VDRADVLVDPSRGLQVQVRQAPKWARVRSWRFRISPLFLLLLALLQDLMLRGAGRVRDRQVMARQGGWAIARATIGCTMSDHSLCL
jgi:hypothetical protein